MTLDAAGRGICIQLYCTQMTRCKTCICGYKGTREIRLTVTTNIYYVSKYFTIQSRCHICNIFHLPVTWVSLLFDKSKLYKTGVPFQVIFNPFTPKIFRWSWRGKLNHCGLNSIWRKYSYFIRTDFDTSKLAQIHKSGTFNGINLISTKLNGSVREPKRKSSKFFQPSPPKPDPLST